MIDSLNSPEKWKNCACGVWGIALDVSCIVTVGSSVYLKSLGLSFCRNPFSNVWGRRPGDVFKPIQIAFTLRRNAGRPIQSGQMKESMPLASRDIRVSFAINIL